MKLSVSVLDWYWQVFKDLLESLAKVNQLLNNEELKQQQENSLKTVKESLDQVADISNTIEGAGQDLGQNLDKFSKDTDKTVKTAIGDANKTLTKFSDDVFKKTDERATAMAEWLEEKWVELYPCHA